MSCSEHFFICRKDLLEYWVDKIMHCTTATFQHTQTKLWEEEKRRKKREMYNGNFNTWNSKVLKFLEEIKMNGEHMMWLRKNGTVRLCTSQPAAPSVLVCYAHVNVPTMYTRSRMCACSCSAIYCSIDDRQRCCDAIYWSASQITIELYGNNNNNNNHMDDCSY